MSEQRDRVRELAEKLHDAVFFNAAGPEALVRAIREELRELLGAAGNYFCEFGPSGICPSGECTHRYCANKREAVKELKEQLEQWTTK